MYFKIGFDEFADQFFKLNIDGDILLSLTPQQLKDDVGVMNGIARQRSVLIYIKQILASSKRTQREFVTIQC